MSTPPTRYERVSRRAALKATFGAGVIALVPGLACGYDDEDVFAGARAQPTPEPASTATPPTTTQETATTEQTGTEQPGAEQLESDPAQLESDPAQSSSGSAVDGEMVISFTYVQSPGGRDERPYIAVWIENAAGELAATVALWYEQGRRGDRWLDHLARWYELDADLLATGAPSEIATVSGATRAPGDYAVVWDGTINDTAAAADSYFVCIEAVREDGPYSLIREPLVLAGQLPETDLPDDGELSLASVRIDA